MKSGQGTALRAVEEFFALLDAEDWDALADRLDTESQLADELTGTWLRGREAVSRYLRAQRDIVTDINSEPSDLVGVEIASGMWFVTFNFAQQYKLAGDPHHQHMTGCCLVKTGESGWEMHAFHLGGANGYIPDGADDPQRVDHVAEISPASPKVQRRENVRTLGEIVKANRIRHDLTLRELAERCGLSASFLSQVERSLTDPSVGSIRQIAAGLNMTAAEIISETESGSPGVLLARPADRTVIAAPHTGGHLQTFPASPDIGLRAALLVFEPHVVMTASDGIHDHDEMIYVLSGSVEITADALRVVLVEGDGATVRAGCRHSYRPLYGGTVRLLVVTAESPKHSNKNREQGAEE